MSTAQPRWIRDEIEWQTPIERGTRGLKAQRIQEWLTLHRYYLQIDGDFGPATEVAVRRFRADSGLSELGVVDAETADLLYAPLVRALQPIPVDGDTLGETVVKLANQHLAEHPREVGGQNRGPWVRMYMKGSDGSPWAWCAGFTSLLLSHACQAHDLASPLISSFSCDAIAVDAKHRGRLMSRRGLSTSELAARIGPGSFFLNRRSATDWTHIGVVVEALDTCFISIEGNTNDDGHREGYEACRRIRGYGSKDFVLV